MQIGNKLFCENLKEIECSDEKKSNAQMKNYKESPHIFIIPHTLQISKIILLTEIVDFRPSENVSPFLTMNLRTNAWHAISPDSRDTTLTNGI